jgi:hypothetical protein
MIFKTSPTAIQRARQYVMERMMYTSVKIQHIPEETAWFVWKRTQHMKEEDLLVQMQTPLIRTVTVVNSKDQKTTFEQDFLSEDCVYISNLNDLQSHYQLQVFLYPGRHAGSDIWISHMEM